ncbi:S-methyl-5-thioribose kinase [Dysosmobacter sp.]|jgi:5-methylthioribose kinase|uniref:S-methyl-5-thioribose kinase n=1 Tax=Dysosmobacter sp. TaxID=2591382 RepID=UPI003FD78723|nr:S-methyl-5-thioribose kinase [Oscillibacter sp.]
MSDYSAFFLMKPEDVKRYAVDVLHFFQPDEETDCVEIGDGNINYVFQVRSRKDGRSVIVKQADKLLRSSGRPLDLYRNKIEAETLMLEARLAPKFIPEVYHYDETMAALSMEDISAYKNLRKELAAGRVYGHLSENLSDFLAQSLLPTTDLVMDRQEKKKQVKFFTNPELCDITEDLVLTEPYLAQPMNPRNKNIVTPGNEDFVREHLYEDEALHAEVAALRNGFMNNAQALIHGDLHSGSIFANEQGIKVIDPEFAFYGPMGYDIGNVIGNLFFAWANKAYTGGSAETQAALEQTIRETCDKTAEKLAAEYDKLVTFPLYRAPAFRKAYLDGVMADSYGYAGTEIIRRVVGDSKVMEVTSVTDPAQRLPMERALIQLGIYLIKNRASGLAGAAVTEEFHKILAEGRGTHGQNG